MNENKTCENCENFRRYYTIGNTHLFLEQCGNCKILWQTVDCSNSCEKWRQSNNLPLKPQNKKRLLLALKNLLLLLNKEIK